MSESVQIGGIGKNPAIDKINSLNDVDVKNYAVRKMEQLLINSDFSDEQGRRIVVPIEFSKANWKGEACGNRYERVQMAGNRLFGRENTTGNPRELEESVRRVYSKEVPLQIETSGDICKFGERQNNNIQFVGETVAGATSLFGNCGSTKNDQSCLPGKYFGTGKKIKI